jgi:methylated-DNA-[protein]-cysteine S-methyltransferase
MKMKSKNFKVKTSLENGVSKVFRIQWSTLGTQKTLRQDAGILSKVKIARDVWLTATPFQRKVWRACMAVPQGSVVTYSDIAVAIGQPRAVRAVANALGRNPIPVRIPCHRVIATGSIGGYSCPFGIKAKQALLKMET